MLSRQVLFRLVCAFNRYVPLIIMGLASCALPQADEAKPAVYSTANLYQDFVQRFASDAAVSGPWIEQAKAMTIRAAYDRMLARSTDATYILDGIQITGTRTWLLKNSAGIATLDARYSNLGEFWAHGSAASDVNEQGLQISQADFTAELRALAAWQPVLGSNGTNSANAPTSPSLGLVFNVMATGGGAGVPPKQVKLTPQPTGSCFPSFQPHTVQQHLNVANAGRKDPTQPWGPYTIGYDLSQGVTPEAILEKHPALQDLANKGWISPNYLVEDFSGTAGSPLLPIGCSTGETEYQAMKRVAGQVNPLLIGIGCSAGETEDQAMTRVAGQLDSFLEGQNEEPSC